jgi:hypothetical protein
MKYLVVSILAALLAAAPAGAQMAPPVPMTPAQFAAAASGQDVTLVVRVNSFERTALVADLLSRVSDSRYKATGKSVALYVPAETPFVMGSAADLQPNAVVFVYGVATTPGRADVKKIVVVTPYVTIE